MIYPNSKKITRELIALLAMLVSQYTFRNISDEHIKHNELNMWPGLQIPASKGGLVLINLEYFNMKLSEGIVWPRFRTWLLEIPNIKNVY